MFFTMKGGSRRAKKVDEDEGCPTGVSRSREEARQEQGKSRAEAGGRAGQEQGISTTRAGTGQE